MAARTCGVSNQAAAGLMCPCSESTVWKAQPSTSSSTRTCDRISSSVWRNQTADEAACSMPGTFPVPLIR